MVIKEALNDKYVRVGHRLSLFERLDRIRNSLKKQKDLLQTVEHLKHEPIQGPPTVSEGGGGDLPPHIKLVFSIIFTSYFTYFIFEMKREMIPKQLAECLLLLVCI